MRMRILLDLSPETVDALNALALQSGKPRAEVIRRAVSSYVSAHVEPLSAFFGLWAEKGGKGRKVYRRLGFRYRWTVWQKFCMLGLIAIIDETGTTNRPSASPDSDFASTALVLPLADVRCSLRFSSRPLNFCGNALPFL